MARKTQKTQKQVAPAFPPRRVHTLAEQIKDGLSKTETIRRTYRSLLGRRIAKRFALNKQVLAEFVKAKRRSVSVLLNRVYRELYVKKAKPTTKRFSAKRAAARFTLSQLERMLAVKRAAK